MAKKKKPSPLTSSSKSSEAPASPSPILTKKSVVPVTLGLGCLLLGFALISVTNPSGDNWASHLCPLLLLSGYICIGLGLSRLSAN
jgi:hypothetical protein